MKIVNTLTKSKEEFKSLISGEIKMYTCGVTVYDHCHIGHGRSLYIFDVMRKYLEHKSFKVKLVRNITDVDDKIIDKARKVSSDKNISLKEAFDEVRTTYIKSYREDLKFLNIGDVYQEPLATDNIPEMIEYTRSLVDKGFAYESEGNVYFSVRKFPGYGKLSGRKIDDLLESVRVGSDKAKKDPLDFALWKKAKIDEPFWDSPWGQGRPGWHIECSVMSQKYLDAETIDIHGGGRDLVFPHHENEITQSEALTGKVFSNYWIHHGLLTINGKKMSKSLGNFVTIKEFKEKYNDFDLLKLFFLAAHYSHSIDFADKKIEEVKKQKKIFYDFFTRVDSWLLNEGKNYVVTSEKDMRKIDFICDKFQIAMDDDFNTAKALGNLFELVDLGFAFLSSDKRDAFKKVREKLAIFFEIFNIRIPDKLEISSKVVLMCQQRQRARRDKDFNKADQIRKNLKENFNFIVSDTANATTLQFDIFE